MNIEYIEEKEPEGWSANGKEASLSNVYMYFNKFIKDPNYHNKEK